MAPGTAIKTVLMSLDLFNSPGKQVLFLPPLISKEIHNNEKIITNTQMELLKVGGGSASLDTQ